MANGILSIVSETGDVIIKVIAGCSGQNARLLADRIISSKMIDRQRIYDLAILIPFGSSSDLVAMDSIGCTKGFEGELPPLYRETFNTPRFDPQSSKETDTFIEVLTYRNETFSVIAGRREVNLSDHRPLGLMPKKRWEELIIEKRYVEVCEAIKRYWDVGSTIPIAWIEEYNDLTRDIKSFDPDLIKKQDEVIKKLPYALLKNIIGEAIICSKLDATDEDILKSVRKELAKYGYVIEET